MACVRAFERGILFALLASLALAPAPAASARSRFHGTLDAGLHSSPELLSMTIFNPLSAESAAVIGVASQPGDMLYSGVFALGAGPKPVYRIHAVIVRSRDGSDVLYADANQDSHLDPSERFPFHPLPRTEENQGEKEAAAFNASLADDPTGPFPMKVRLVTEPGRIRAKPHQLPVLYSRIAFVQGYARLLHRKVRMHFQYDFATRSVDIGHAREWIDLNGDGKLDMTPGESLQAHGTAPVFRVGKITLQLASVDLRMQTFVLRKVAAAAAGSKLRAPRPQSKRGTR